MLGTFIAWLKRDEFVSVKGLSNWVGAKLDWTTPNKVTLSRTALMIPALPLLYAGKIGGYTICLVLAIFLTTLVPVGDGVDGAQARYQERIYRIKKMKFKEERKKSFRERLGMKGKTHLGDALDPFADKVMSIGVFLVLGLPGDYLNFSILVGVCDYAVLLTALRVIQSRMGLKRSANRFGKWKVYMEIACMASLILLPRSEQIRILANYLLLCAFVLALFSFWSHIFTGCVSLTKGELANEEE